MKNQIDVIIDVMIEFEGKYYYLIEKKLKIL